MRKLILAIACGSVASVGALIACVSDTPGGTGGVGQPCNSNGTCQTGLTCASNLCVMIDGSTAADTSTGMDTGTADSPSPTDGSDAGADSPIPDCGALTTNGDQCGLGKFYCYYSGFNCITDQNMCLTASEILQCATTADCPGNMPSCCVPAIFGPGCAATVTVNPMRALCQNLGCDGGTVLCSKESECPPNTHCVESNVDTGSGTLRLGACR